MPIKPKYCAKCGQTLTARELEGRVRTVCPACQTVFYENPLPVAAAVVLNEQREVLLVKRRREPHQGQWCLPMGFAEIGETIAEAAQRELREEAGIEAEIVRLLTAESHDSRHYGDLLIVTFELRKTGGRERAGDDAEEVRYFPINAPPPLPFASNARALRACEAAHLEEWAIRDSFVTLQAQTDQAMLSDTLVALIQERAEEVARAWLADVRANPSTRCYQALDEQQLLQRGTCAISQFGRWLKGSAADEEVKEFYRILARERRSQGLPVHELLSSLTLLKKHVWEFASRHHRWEQPIDVYRLLELSRRLALFFDKAMYQAARGFGEARG